MVFGVQGQGAVCRRLHGASAEAAAQQGAEVAKHRLAADDEHPRIHDGIEGVEAEGRQVLPVVGKRVNGVDEACDLKEEGEGLRLELVFINGKLLA